MIADVRVKSAHGQVKMSDLMGRLRALFLAMVSSRTSHRPFLELPIEAEGETVRTFTMTDPHAVGKRSVARAALNDGKWVMGADGAQLPLGPGRSVRLQRAPDGFKVVAVPEQKLDGEAGAVALTAGPPPGLRPLRTSTSPGRR